jgi:hypothetical protein
MLHTLLFIPASGEASIEERVNCIRGHSLPIFPAIHDPPPLEALLDSPSRDRAVSDGAVAETLPESGLFSQRSLWRLHTGRKSLRLPTVMAVKRPSLFGAEWLGEAEENEQEISTVSSNLSCIRLELITSRLLLPLMRRYHPKRCLPQGRGRVLQQVVL